MSAGEQRNRWRGAVWATCCLTLCCGDGDDGSDDSEPTPELPPETATTDSEGCVMTVRDVDNEGATHVNEGSELSFESNPPASGNHYPVWTRFETFDPEVVPRGYWVHNLEHGGIVFLYGPAAEAGRIDALSEVFDALPTDPQCNDEHSRALWTYDPELDDEIAVVAWDVVLEGNCVSREQIDSFVLEHRGQAPENICTHGSYVP